MTVTNKAIEVVRLWGGTAALVGLLLFLGSFAYTAEAKLDDTAPGYDRIVVGDAVVGGRFERTVRLASPTRPADIPDMLAAEVRSLARAVRKAKAEGRDIADARLVMKLRYSLEPEVDALFVGMEYDADALIGASARMAPREALSLPRKVSFDPRGKELGAKMCDRASDTLSDSKFCAVAGNDG